MCRALAGIDVRSLLLRWRAGRPQLKRDPLGGYEDPAMTVPTPEIPVKAKTTTLMRWPLLVIAIVGIVYTWLAGWPTVAQRRAAIEECRRRYGQARTHGDTVRVDAFALGRRTWDPQTFCGDYRRTGMR